MLALVLNIVRSTDKGTVEAKLFLDTFVLSGGELTGKNRNWLQLFTCIDGWRFSPGAKR